MKFFKKVIFVNNIKTISGKGLRLYSFKKVQPERFDKLTSNCIFFSMRYAVNRFLETVVAEKITI